MKKETYKDYADRKATKSPLLKDMCLAFLFGGGICVLGQLLNDLYSSVGLSEENGKTLVSVTLIFIAIVLTGFGVFDDIAKRAGAGTLVPITGFANAMASPAIDAKSEGWVLGVGAKIFVVAGPVILYGTLASTLYGVIYYIVKMVAGG